MTRIFDLSHDITPGMYTHPGLPGPDHEPFRTREQYRQSTGTTFQVDRVCMVGNTGTYLDSPFHRFADGIDLAGVPLTAVADVPVLVVDARGGRAVGADAIAAALADLAGGGGNGNGDGDDGIAGAAVLVRTDGDAAWGSEAYAADAPYLTADAADWLAARRPVLVGIDSVNIDDLADTTRPVHTRLLGDGVLVLEHLTGLAHVPSRGARLHAVPLAWHGVGTWPVRAYAMVADA